MRFTDDEMLFIETLKDMGVEFQEGQGGLTINGVEAVEYLQKHDIFEVPEEQYISLDISSQGISENDIYMLDSESLLQAA